jgi:tetratricopeptide (TPR) repeat protein
MSKNLSVLDTYSQKLKGDSVSVVQILDSAKIAYGDGQFMAAINFASRSFELSKKFPHEDFTIESTLILARSYKSIHLLDKVESAFKNAIKYYLKAITTLESAGSTLLLPQVYIEYGDFYSSLKIPKLTVENYEKALKIIRGGNDSGLQISLLKQIAQLQFELEHYAESIENYLELAGIYRDLSQTKECIEVLNTLSALYLKVEDFDNACRGQRKYWRIIEKITMCRSRSRI